MSQTHEISFRVYYQDTDAGGVMYHGTYLNFAERARTEFLRDLGFSQDNLQNDANLVFVVKNLHIDFLSAARLDNELRIVTDIISVGGASLQVRQSFYNGQVELTTLQIVLVAVSLDSFKPQVIPSALREKLSSYMAS